MNRIRRRSVGIRCGGPFFDGGGYPAIYSERRLLDMFRAEANADLMRAGEAAQTREFSASRAHRQRRVDGFGRVEDRLEKMLVHEDLPALCEVRGPLAPLLQDGAEVIGGLRCLRAIFSRACWRVATASLDREVDAQHAAHRRHRVRGIAGMQSSPSRYHCAEVIDLHGE